MFSKILVGTMLPLDMEANAERISRTVGHLLLHRTRLALLLRVFKYLPCSSSMCGGVQVRSRCLEKADLIVFRDGVYVH